MNKYIHSYASYQYCTVQYSTAVCTYGTWIPVQLYGTVQLYRYVRTVHGYQYSCTGPYGTVHVLWYQWTVVHSQRACQSVPYYCCTYCSTHVLVLYSCTVLTTVRTVPDCTVRTVRTVRIVLTRTVQYGTTDGAAGASLCGAANGAMQSHVHCARLRDCSCVAA